MGSKAILFLCLFALVMMIASEVSARDLAETETKGVEESKYGRGGYNGPGGGGYPAKGVEESKYGGGGYGRGGGGGGYGRGGGGGGGYGRGGGGYGRGGGGGGGYGRGGGGCHCCGSHYCRCCTSAGEVVNAETETKPQN